MKIVSVVGARPQFIKAAVLLHHLAITPPIDSRLVHTGQHYDPELSQVFFDNLSIPKPHYALDVGSLSHGAQTGRMLEQLEEVFLDEKPDWVIVYGDTNSTLAAALAASKLHIPLAHVEAGLRSYNRHMPEEINRVLTDHLSKLLFTPSKAANHCLAQEGIYQGVHNVGDIMLDAIKLYKNIAHDYATAFTHHKLKAQNYTLVTLHRAENTDNPERLKTIINALCEFAKQHAVVWPLHPRTKKYLENNNLLAKVEAAIQLIAPQDYLNMYQLQQHAQLIITDSGGLQKEAYYHQIPCVTLRTETEWHELLVTGWNRLVSPDDKSLILSTLNEALSTTITPHQGLYGTGNTALQIIAMLQRA